MRLLDSKGKMVKKVVDDNENPMIEMNLEGVVPGLYFVEIILNKEVLPVVKKVIVQ